jgi:hypothetical protein
LFLIDSYNDSISLPWLTLKSLISFFIIGSIPFGSPLRFLM